jgi:hypothetical protein
MRRLHRSLAISWIAILALLLNSMMPLAAQAMESLTRGSGAQASNWVEVCGTQKSSWLRVDAAGQVLERVEQPPANTPTNTPAAAHMAKCAYCLTHDVELGLVCASPLPLIASTFRSRFTAFYHSPDLRQLAWLVPAVRAPPSLL